MKQINRPNLRVQRREATRATVLEAARDEFERLGFDGASIRSIAARAGVSVGTVMHYGSDKRVLLHAALFDELKRVIDRALRRLGTGPVQDELGRLARAVLRAYAARPALSRTLLKESLFAEGDWAQRFAQQAADVAAAVAGFLTRAQQRGALSAHLQPHVAAAAWLSFFYFALIGWVQGVTPRPARFVDTLMAQHLGAHSPRAAR